MNCVTSIPTVTLSLVGRETRFTHVLAGQIVEQMVKLCSKPPDAWQDKSHFRPMGYQKL